MDAFGIFSCRFAKKKNSELKRKFQLFGDKFLFWHILLWWQCPRGHFTHDKTKIL